MWLISYFLMAHAFCNLHNKLNNSFSILLDIIYYAAADTWTSCSFLLSHPSPLSQIPQNQRTYWPRNTTHWPKKDSTETLLALNRFLQNILSDSLRCVLLWIFSKLYSVLLCCHQIVVCVFSGHYTEDRGHP